MDVYRGTDKVATLGSYNELRVGANEPAFVYEGSELVYPNPVKDGLVLWYDFSGRTNADGQRGVAEDLSGNGNHGTLQNFNFTPESGYDKNKLLSTGLRFDGVDDRAEFPIISFSETDSWTSELWYEKGEDRLMFILGYGGAAESLVVSHVYLGYRATDSTYLRWDSTPEIISQINHFVVVYENGMFSYYANGELVHEIEKMSSSKFRYLGNSYASPGFAYGGVINSTRIYNRPLTPEEIAHNYQIEKERFNL